MYQLQSGLGSLDSFSCSSAVKGFETAAAQPRSVYGEAPATTGPRKLKGLDVSMERFDFKDLMHSKIVSHGIAIVLPKIALILALFR